MKILVYGSTNCRRDTVYKILRSQDGNVCNSYRQLRLITGTLVSRLTFSTLSLLSLLQFSYNTPEAKFNHFAFSICIIIMCHYYNFIQKSYFEFRRIHHLHLLFVATSSIDRHVRHE